MGMQSEDITAVLNGVTASDTVYYALGGAILVVLAGVWGFLRVYDLLAENGYVEGRNGYNGVWYWDVDDEGNRFKNYD